MRTLTVSDRILGHLLGLGDLQYREPCHGYANGCACSACDERLKWKELPAPESPRQPWEPL